MWSGGTRDPGRGHDAADVDPKRRWSWRRGAASCGDAPATAELRVKIEGKDALPLDDEASIAPRAKTGGSVLLVAADASGLSAPRGSSHLEVVGDVTAPSWRASRDLAIFHLAAPALLHRPRFTSCRPMRPSCPHVRTRRSPDDRVPSPHRRAIPNRPPFNRAGH
jgi:hypothetical protein